MPASTSSRRLFQTPRFAVHCDTVVDERGTRVEYYYVRKPDAVTIIPHTDDAILFLKLSRHLVPGDSYELPGGRIDPGETILDAARRELQEEAGFASAPLTFLASVYPLPSVTTEQVHIFAALLPSPTLPALNTLVQDEGIRSHTFVPFTEVPAFVHERVRCAADGYAALLFLSRIQRLAL